MDRGFDLAGKTVVITGASSGIGRATALRFADCGANIVLGARRADKLEEVIRLAEEKGVRAIAVKTDVTVEEDVHRLVDTAVQEFGKLDIMVNNAGVCMVKPFPLCTAEDYDKVYTTNVRGTIFGCQAALKHMIPQKTGKIVNVSSMAGKEAGPVLTLYSSSKFAVVGLTQALAKEVGSLNINVNAVCPGSIMTDMLDGADGVNATVAKVLGISKEQYVQTLLRRIPLGRPQTENDIANMILFLSSELSANITAQAFNVTGGMVNH